jgi:hypothetical protein
MVILFPRKRNHFKEHFGHEGRSESKIERPKEQDSLLICVFIFGLFTMWPICYIISFYYVAQMASVGTVINHNFYLRIMESIFI